MTEAPDSDSEASSLRPDRPPPTKRHHEERRIANPLSPNGKYGSLLVCFVFGCGLVHIPLFEQFVANITILACPSVTCFYFILFFFPQPYTQTGKISKIQPENLVSKVRSFWSRFHLLAFEFFSVEIKKQVPPTGRDTHSSPTFFTPLSSGAYTRR